MSDLPAAGVSNDDVAKAVRDTLDLFLADHPDFEANGVEVEIGDYEWSTDGQLVGIVIDGERFTVTVTRVSPVCPGQHAAQGATPRDGVWPAAAGAPC